MVMSQKVADDLREAARAFYEERTAFLNANETPSVRMVNLRNALFAADDEDEANAEAVRLANNPRPKGCQCPNPCPIHPPTP